MQGTTLEPGPMEYSLGLGCMKATLETGVIEADLTLRLDGWAARTSLESGSLVTGWVLGSIGNRPEI